MSMYPSRLHAAGMCMCVSCDPGQVLLLLGLFAEKLWSSGPATGDHAIDRNCSSPNSCCSAFHSSIVKVHMLSCKQDSLKSWISSLLFLYQGRENWLLPDAPKGEKYQGV